MPEWYDPFPKRVADGRTLGFVYFIQAPDSGHIKIGWSMRPDKRLAELQTAQPTPLRMLGLLAGSKEREKELHERFADARAAGEWFKSGQVLEPVMEMLADFGILAEGCTESRNSPEQTREPRYYCCLVEV